MKKDKNSEVTFPHTGFPIRMEYLDNDVKYVCYFDNKVNMEKHKARLKKIKKFKIDEKPADVPYSN